MKKLKTQRLGSLPRVNTVLGRTGIKPSFLWNHMFPVLSDWLSPTLAPRWAPPAKCKWWLNSWVSAGPRQQSRNCAAQAQKCPLSEGEDQGRSQEVCLEEGEAVWGASQVCLTWQLHSQPGRWIQQQIQAGASAASERPQAHTQVVLASLLYSKGRSLVMWDPVSASTLESEPWFPGWGKQGWTGFFL